MEDGLSESWFWLALNHGQLQQYREAYRYLRKYLEYEPQGDYSWQAQEILDYLRTDLPMLSPGEKNQMDELCSRGIELVNQGKVQEAIQCFAQAETIEPGMSSPRNNLALCWLYLGDVEKAIETTEAVLDCEPDNVFANCNLAVFYQIIGDQLALRRQIQVLNGLWTEESQEILKLGTTFGVLGLDRRALDIFRYFYDAGHRSFELLLLLGIAYYNCQRREQAEQCFVRVNELEPDNPYAALLEACQEGKVEKLPYHLRVPHGEIANLLEKEPQGEDAAGLEDPDLWPQVMWVIRNGNGGARQRLVEAILQAQHQPLQELLAAEVWDLTVDFDCRRDLFTAFVAAGIPVWQECSKKKDFTAKTALVLERVLEILHRRGHGFVAMNKVYSAWAQHCRNHRPRIRNTELWIAALLVFVDGLESGPETAANFGQSVSSLIKAVRQLTGSI